MSGLVQGAPDPRDEGTPAQFASTGVPAPVRFR